MIAVIAYGVAAAVFGFIAFAAWGENGFRKLDEKHPDFGICPVCATKNWHGTGYCRLHSGGLL